MHLTSKHTSKQGRMSHTACMVATRLIVTIIVTMRIGTTAVLPQLVVALHYNLLNRIHMAHMATSPVAQVCNLTLYDAPMSLSC